MFTKLQLQASVRYCEPSHCLLQLTRTGTSCQYGFLGTTGLQQLAGTMADETHVARAAGVQHTKQTTGNPGSVNISLAQQSHNQQSQKTRHTQAEMTLNVLLPSTRPLVDIGINLVDKSFDKDRAAVIQRARDAGVMGMVVTGTCMRTSKAAAKLCGDTVDYPLHFTAGVHPHNAKMCDSSTLQQLRQLALHPHCVAIGECGLDFNRNFSPQDVQQTWFEAQVILAKELQMPLFMHCRDATDAFTAILRKHHPLPCPAVIHCFTGNKQELQCMLELGLYIGITGWICDDRPERGGAELAGLLKDIPRDRLMIETDAPYLVPRTIKPSKMRPGRNEPALLPYVLKTAADALGVSMEEVTKPRQMTLHCFNCVALELKKLG